MFPSLDYTMEGQLLLQAWPPGSHAFGRYSVQFKAVRGINANCPSKDIFAHRQYWLGFI